MCVFCKNADEEYSISLSMFAQLTQDDYIEVFVSNETNTGDITLSHFHLRAFSVFTV